MATNTILLDGSFSITCDGKSATLEQLLIKNRINPDTLEREEYLVKDKWFLLNVPQALRKYRDLILEESSDLKDIFSKLDELNSKIDSFKLDQ